MQTRILHRRADDNGFSTAGPSELISMINVTEFSSNPVGYSAQKVGRIEASQSRLKVLQAMANSEEKICLRIDQDQSGNAEDHLHIGSGLLLSSDRLALPEPIVSTSHQVAF